MDRRFRLGFCLALVTALGACAGPERVALSEDDAKWLGGRTATNRLHEKPDFVAATAERGMMGVFGVAVMVSEGNKIVAENDVTDPAKAISVALGRMLASRLNVEFRADQRPAFASAGADDADRPQTDWPQTAAEVVLDVETLGWGLRYFPADWDNYMVSYSARLNVVERATGRVLAQDRCVYAKEYEDSNSAPSYHELTRDRARGLKRELGEAAGFCAKQFAALLLGG